ncbi:MAG: hypothetical protein JWQ96_965 [Segetibacter sp.]|nr:hypothetical protein [Segetibacter sp.]
MLTAAILQGMFQSDMGGIFEDIFKGKKSRSYSGPFQIFTGYYFLAMFASWATIIAMQVVIVSYLKVYEAKGNTEPEISEVWNQFQKYFLSVFVYSIPLLLLTVVGFAFCIAPGVYFAVVFMIFPVVLIMEEVSFGEAFNRCFTLIKDNFWSSLLIYFVVYLIYAFGSGIISAIVGLITGLISYFTTNDIGTTMGIVTSVLNIFSFVFYIIFYISVIIHYFTLTEKYDGTGMMRRLETLGATGTTTNTEEEY